MSSGPGKPSVAAVQQLQQHQQQLVAQMQMTQHALVLHGSTAASNNQQGVSDKDGGNNGRERHHSETYGSTGSSDGSLKENRPDNNNGDLGGNLGIKTELNGNLQGYLSGRHSQIIPGRSRHPSGPQPRKSFSPPISSSLLAQPLPAVPPRRPSASPPAPSPSSLFVHGHCNWPGCDTACTDQSTFRRHLNDLHRMDDKASAQARVQAQIVSQLEVQLTKERNRLRAMMSHLGMDSRDSTGGRSPSPKRARREEDEPPRSPPEKRPAYPSFGLQASSQRAGGSYGMPPSLVAAASNLQSPLSALTAAVRSPLLAGNSASSTGLPTGATGPLRPKPTATLVDRNPSEMALPPGFDERRGRGDRGNPNLDPEMDIKLNREFYKNNDVRPPYTYAALIRYVSQTSPRFHS